MIPSLRAGAGFVPPRLISSHGTSVRTGRYGFTHATTLVDLLALPWHKEARAGEISAQEYSASCMTRSRLSRELLQSGAELQPRSDTCSRECTANRLMVEMGSRFSGRESGCLLRKTDTRQRLTRVAIQRKHGQAAQLGANVNPLVA